MQQGAALLLLQQGYGACMVEWSAREVQVAPAEGLLVHANHGLRLVDSRAASQLLLEDSKRRQAALEEQLAEWLLAKQAPPLDL